MAAPTCRRAADRPAEPELGRAVLAPTQCRRARRPAGRDRPKADICTAFYLIESRFLASYTLVSITRFAAPAGIIVLGIVLVLLLGEIDLSVGTLSGFVSAVMAVLVVRHGQSILVGMIAATAVGAAIGVVYGPLRTRVGVPSFVFSLAGLLAVKGALLYVLGDDGTVTVPSDSWPVQFAKFEHVPHGLSCPMCSSRPSPASTSRPSSTGGPGGRRPVCPAATSRWSSSRRWRSAAGWAS